jgi:glutamyl-Q tRNA(Asp) synthetase
MDGPYDGQVLECPHCHAAVTFQAVNALTPPPIQAVTIDEVIPAQAAPPVLGAIPITEIAGPDQAPEDIAAALEQLKARGLVYPCFCTRADIASSLTAPHGDAGSSYPGTCRELPDDPERRASTPHSWRLDCAKALAAAGMPGWTEHDGRRFTADPADIGDAILARKDAPASYHLACVTDDAASGVTLVVRGADLRPSSPLQPLLQMLLGLPEPVYVHHPLVTHEDGRRLAKRDLAPTLAAMREAGVDGHKLAADLMVGQLPLGFTFGEG